jgi:hypothetical protein
MGSTLYSDSEICASLRQAYGEKQDYHVFSWNCENYQPVAEEVKTKGVD